eukprot:2827743-Rhodomonas_salina.1
MSYLVQSVVAVNVCGQIPSVQSPYPCGSFGCLNRGSAVSCPRASCSLPPSTSYLVVVTIGALSTDSITCQSLGLHVA